LEPGQNADEGERATMGGDQQTRLQKSKNKRGQIEQGKEIDWEAALKKTKRKVSKQREAWWSD